MTGTRHQPANILQMRKVIAAFNMTLDGICDHTTGIADDELHEHYSELIDHAGVILYGRITFQLMQFWQDLLAHPSGKKSLDRFAISIDRTPKLVFSTTMEETYWNTATLSDLPLREKILKLKQEPGRDILVGSRSLIIQLLNNHLIDEFQICIHPLIEGNGLRLFDEIRESINLKLLKTKILSSGTVVCYYHPNQEK